jgi:exodeoxyribonuclease VII small subunit
MAETTPIAGLSYEEAFEELEKIVDTLESNQRSLEDAMSLFERGQGLSEHCASLLDQAELKIRQLTEEDGAEIDSEG